MALLRFGRTLRGAQRLTEILQILAKHGLGHLVYRLNLQRFVPLGRRLRRAKSDVAPDTLARRATMALEELGPTFIKLGQLLSTRPDIVPEPFVKEFQKLQDKVTPFPPEQARLVIERELGAPMSQLFRAFQDEPAASGSVAQVHHAETLDGQRVVVKVKRPGIERIMRTDLELMGALARLAEQHFPEMRLFRPAMIVEELGRTLQRELDFMTEAAFTAKFFEHFRERENVKSPRVFWKYTTSSLLTIDHLDGTKVSDLEHLAAAGIDRRELAQHLASTFAEQYLELGMFHADPHPGNLLVSPKGALILLDFGQVGHLSEELKSQLTDLLQAVVSRDAERAVEVYAEMGVFSEKTRPAELRAQFLEMLDKYYGLPLARLDPKWIFNDLTGLARAHGVTLPREVVILGKSFVTMIGLAKQLDPELDPASIVEKYTKKLIWERYSPTRLGRKVASQTSYVLRWLERLPRDINSLLRKIQEGNLQVIFKHQGLDHMIYELDRSSNRLAFSIILASIVVASSLIMANQIGPLAGGISILGVIGYVFAGFLGIWLLVAILRSGRL